MPKGVKGFQKGHKLFGKNIGDIMRGKTSWNKGKKFSEESRKKMSLAKIGKKHSPETRKKMSEKKLGKKHSVEQRMRASIRMSGSNCNFWRGGVSSVNGKIRRSLEARLWREAVFQRDNYTCVWCGARSGNGRRVTLNADHIKPFALYPELRFAIDNGRTLCVPCHRTTDTYGSKTKIP